MPLIELGEHLRLVEERNEDAAFTLADVRGVNNLKRLMPTKANVSNRDLTRFQIVRPGMFVFNHRTSRNGSKFSIALNDGDAAVIVTEDYVVFSVDDTEIDPLWLYMYFCRPEFDRYVITNSWGSSTEFYNWADLCDVRLQLPLISVQREYVNLYRFLSSNLSEQLALSEATRAAFQAAVERVRSGYPVEQIGSHLRIANYRNTDKALELDAVRGISTSKVLIPTKANMTGVSLKGYKIVQPGEIAFVPDTSRRGDKISLAQNTEDAPVLVSSISTVFQCDRENLLPEYLMLFLSRPEFDRYARFHSWGSARETFNWDDMCDLEIPMPPIEVQESVSALLRAHTASADSQARTTVLLKKLNSILIKGSLDEARREVASV